jgi:hypothetical protein
VGNVRGFLDSFCEYVEASSNGKISNLTIWFRYVGFFGARSMIGPQHEATNPFATSPTTLPDYYHLPLLNVQPQFNYRVLILTLLPCAKGSSG